MNNQRQFHNLLLVSFLFFTSIYSFAQKRVYTTQKVSTPPHIDGIIDDPVWDAVEWQGDFVQIMPYENRPPSQETKFKVIYDDDNIYIGVRAYDTAIDSIERKMSRRDEFEGDWIEINFDSYHDLRTAFSFTATVAGVRNDESISNDNDWDDNWDAIWRFKTSIDSAGWIAEIEIPLNQLRFGKQDEYVWGFQVKRYIYRHAERSCWQFISRNASGWVHNLGELHGIKNITPQKQKDFTPYVSAKYENYQKEYGNPFATGKDFTPAIGLDGKIGVTNDLTLDFTINPDFGQVEADPSEVNLTTFETFFDEKRAFFIEGKNILTHELLKTGDSPMSQDNLFYSRRIGKQPSRQLNITPGIGEYAKTPDNTTILGAFKLSGKTPKGLSVGILESATQRETAQIALNGDKREEVVEPFTNYFAARVEKDMNNSNTRLGGMINSVNRNLEAQPYLENYIVKDAYTAGINFNHQWNDKTYFVDINAVYSHLSGNEEAIYNLQTGAPHFFQRPDADYLQVDSTRRFLNGTGGSIIAGKQGNGKLSYTGWLSWRSPGLNLNDMGYMKSNDEIMQLVWVEYNQNTPFSIFRSINVQTNQWMSVTFGFDKRYSGANISSDIKFKNYWSTGVRASRTGKSLSTETLRGGPALLYDEHTDYNSYIGSDNRKKVWFKVSYYGDVKTGKTAINNRYTLAVNMQISNAFQLSIEPSYSDSYDEIAYVKSFNNTNPGRYIRGTLEQKTSSFTWRFTYNIGPDFTIQYYTMPFISAGNYKQFKYVSNPRANNFNDRFVNYSDAQISEHIDNVGKQVFRVDENLDGANDYEFKNPNFNLMDFNSNLVIRWEYLPGSTLYLVWTQNRNNFTNRGTYSFVNDSRDLFLETYPYDVFLIKFSYRFGL